MTLTSSRSTWMRAARSGYLRVLAAVSTEAPTQGRNGRNSTVPRVHHTELIRSRKKRPAPTLCSQGRPPDWKSPLTAGTPGAGYRPKPHDRLPSILPGLDGSMLRRMKGLFRSDDHGRNVARH